MGGANTDSSDASAAFDVIAAGYLDDPRVSTGTGFGSNPGLRVDGRIFAMLWRGTLVVKLPRARVDELVESGQATRFDSGRGRPMAEWASIGADREPEWAEHASMAFAFVSAAPKR